MRVLNLITDRDRRGAQVFATDLAGGLTDLGDSVSTVALAPGGHGDLLDVEVLGPTRRSATTLAALRSAAREADIVIAHGSTTLFACATSLAGVGTPFVYRQISDPLYWAATWARRLRTAMMLRRAAGIVALSPITRDVLQTHYRLPASAIRVIPNAVPAASFAPATTIQRSEARQVFGLDDAAVVVGYVGALVAEKGVEALADVVGSTPDLHLLVAGGGPLRSDLLDVARSSGGRMTIVGALDDPRPVYWACDTIALPSISGDTMPAALIEAGLCGLPCISTPVGAITDIVRHEQTGLIVPAGSRVALDESVRRLADSSALRRSLGSAALDHCAQFTIEATAPRWREYLRQIVG